MVADRTGSGCMERRENCERPIYPSGSWGPKESDQLLERDGRLWYNP